jgi:hypothetical protein
MARCVQTIIAISCSVVWTTAGHTQPAEVSIEVSECLSFQNDLERYACYERLTRAALSAASGTDQTPPATLLNDASPSAPRADPGEPVEIRSSIVAVEQRRPNEHEISLENGQVWRQSPAKRYPLRVGQEVRIYSTRWGDSFRLSATELNGYIQVERIE